MNKVNIIAAAASIISFIGAIVSGLLGGYTASVVMVILAIATGIIALYKNLFRENACKLECMHKELEISSTKRNHQHVNSSFLDWEQCILMLWVLVPPSGQGLRNALHFRYLLAHQTNDPQESQNYNMFSLRYTPDNNWEVTFTNNRAEYPPEPLRIRDGLQPGWHRFLISWNRSKPEIVFRIDEGQGGDSRSSSYLPYWLKNRADSVIIGAWVSQYEDSYCETTLYKLWICDRPLESLSSVLKRHRMPDSAISR